MEETVKKALLLKLEEIYGDEGCALHFTNAFELLIATMLSAQTTDIQVNKVTPALFARCPDANAMADISQSELEDLIRSIGFFRTKAAHIIETCSVLRDEFNGEVPRTMEELTSLPGVGRKTANVVLSNAMGVPGIAVDTHVFRVSNRLGLAHAKDVKRTEEQLMAEIPREKWSQAHHWLIWHGRRVCDARRPDCEHCPTAIYCETYRLRTGER